MTMFVIPAKAGTQPEKSNWTPASAGVTGRAARHAH
jgi:hypothetical protein